MVPPNKANSLPSLFNCWLGFDWYLTKTVLPLDNVT